MDSKPILKKIQSLKGQVPVSRINSFFAAILAFTPSFAAHAQTLSLDGYLAQVEGKNQNVIAAKEFSEGAKLAVSEGDLMYSPTLFIDASWLNDKFPNALFPTAYSSTYNYTYTAGIRQTTAWGLRGAISYDLNNIGYLNSAFGGGTPTDRTFWEGTPKIELNLSLWRNLFGTETQAQKQLTETSAMANQYNNSFQAKNLRAAAESAYVRLVSAQELIRVYQSSVEKSEELLKWINRQVGLRLGDNTDLYQAQANLEGQRLNLQAALDDYRIASRDFNRIRNVDSDEVKERLVLPSITNLKIPVRSQHRDDTIAAQQSARLSAAQARLGEERNRPTLEAFGSLAPNARYQDLGSTFSNSWALGFQTTLIGVRFSMPLGLGMSSDARHGFERQRLAAEKLVNQKEFEENVMWKDLVKQFDEAKKRYEIATRLADIQKKKVDAEVVRLRRGRTTTYQTVLFNQDYNQSEAAKILAQSRILNIHSQMKTFGGSEQ